MEKEAPPRLRNLFLAFLPVPTLNLPVVRAASRAVHGLGCCGHEIGTLSFLRREVNLTFFVSMIAPALATTVFTRTVVLGSSGGGVGAGQPAIGPGLFRQRSSVLSPKRSPSLSRSTTAVIGRKVPNRAAKSCENG